MKQDTAVKILMNFCGGYNLPSERTWQMLDTNRGSVLPLRDNEAFTLDKLDSGLGYSPRVIAWLNTTP